MVLTGLSHAHPRGLKPFISNQPLVSHLRRQVFLVDHVSPLPSLREYLFIILHKNQGKLPDILMCFTI